MNNLSSLVAAGALIATLGTPQETEKSSPIKIDMDNVILEVDNRVLSTMDEEAQATAVREALQPFVGSVRQCLSQAASTNNFTEEEGGDKETGMTWVMGKAACGDMFCTKINGITRDDRGHLKLVRDARCVKGERTLNLTEVDRFGDAEKSSGSAIDLQSFELKGLTVVNANGIPAGEAEVSLWTTMNGFEPAAPIAHSFGAGNKPAVQAAFETSLDAIDSSFNSVSEGIRESQ